MKQSIYAEKAERGGLEVKVSTGYPANENGPKKTAKLFSFTSEVARERTDLAKIQAELSVPKSNKQVKMFLRNPLHLHEQRLVPYSSQFTAKKLHCVGNQFVEKSTSYKAQERLRMIQPVSFSELKQHKQLMHCLAAFNDGVKGSDANEVVQLAKNPSIQSMTFD